MSEQSTNSGVANVLLHKREQTILLTVQGHHMFATPQHALGAKGTIPVVYYIHRHNREGWKNGVFHCRPHVYLGLLARRRYEQPRR